MPQAPMEPGTELVLLIDKQAETAEIFLHKSLSPGIASLTFIAMSGDLDNLEQVRWLASSAASFHNIPFKVENM